MRPRLLVAEDESPLRADLVARLVRLWPEAELVAEVADGLAALEAIEAARPSVAFLDVRMPELTGLEVARQVAGRCHVIFVTAHDDTAVAAFEAGVIDFLLKPVSDERLLQAIERVKHRLTEAPADLSALVAQLAAAQSQQSLRWVQASSGRTIEFVPVQDVAFFQADEKYTTVRTAAKELLIRTPLKELLSRLDGERFWQVHRSTIVNVDFIDRVVRTEDGDLEVCLKGVPEPVPVSRSFRFRFKYM